MVDRFYKNFVNFIRTCYQGVTNVSFSENFAYALNEWSPRQIPRTKLFLFTFIVDFWHELSQRRNLQTVEVFWKDLVGIAQLITNINNVKTTMVNSIKRLSGKPGKT